MIDNVVHVLCRNNQCEHFGKIRRVRLDTVAVGVLAYPVFLCMGCGMVMPRAQEEDVASP